MDTTSIKLKSDLNFDLALNNYNKLSNIIRVLILKTYPKLLEKYQEENDSFFMNPLIFAFFNNQEIQKSEDVLEAILRNSYVKTITLEGSLNYFEEIPEMIRPFLFIAKNGHIINSRPNFNLTCSKIYQAKKALNIIEKYLPTFYKEFELANTLLLFHDNTQILNFATKSFHGFLSFWVTEDSTEIGHFCS